MSVVQKVNFGNGQLNQFMYTQNATQPVTQQVPTYQIQAPDNSVKNIAYISSALALLSLGVTAGMAIKSGGKKVKVNDENNITIIQQTLKNFSVELQELKAKSAAEAKMNEIYENLLGMVKGLEKKIADTGEWHDNWLKDVDKKVQENGDFAVGWLKSLEERINSVAYKVSGLSATERNTTRIDNLNLLQNLQADGSRVELPKNVIDELQSVAGRIIHNKTNPPKLDKNATVWSLTAESIPEKEGGLGEVPVQIAKNMTKELGISNYLLRPVNEIPGVSSIVEKDGKFHYRYKDLHMDVDKVAEFEIYAFRNGRTEKEAVEVFVGEDPKFGFKRMMFRNKDFFMADGLYKDSQRASEKERFAFFPKAVYEFAKIKMDPNATTSYKIFNEELFNKIPAPDTLLLNDWHTASMAGLTKLLAPVEAGMGELSKPVAKKMKDMNIVEIIHNADYQGQDWQHASDIMNTLYGKYAYDIYTNAKTGLEPAGLQNIHFIDGSINLANIAAALADKIKPVSPNYARELGAEFARGHSLQHIFQTRLDAGTMQGQSNGWDRTVNEVSYANLPAFNNNLNMDKFTIIKEGLDSLELSKSLRESLAKIFTDDKGHQMKFKVDNFDKIIKELKELQVPKIDAFLDEMEASGVLKLRKFKAETNTDSIEDIMEVRRYNKGQFLEYLKSVSDYNNSKDRLFNIAEEGVTDLSGIDFNDLDNQVVINCGTRFVSQKGVDIAAGVMKQILKEWPEKYPGKPKPIFAIGGVDGEGGHWERQMRDFKALMGEDANTVYYTPTYTPNNLFHAGSDITWYPSHFEPDGSKWESLNRGTPVVATRVGGHVDSIVDGVNGYLTARTVPQIKESGYDYLETMIYDFKEATYRAIDAFFDKNKWQDMVRHSIDGDQSWLIKDKDGRFVGGSLLGHLEDLGFNLNDFPKIASSDARKAFAESQSLQKS